MMRIVLLSLAVSYASAIVCPENACAAVSCLRMTAADCVGGTIVQGGGYCGCCDSCVTSLAEGEKCFSSLFLGVPATAQCADGLVCDPSTATCTDPSALLASKRDVVTCAQRVQQMNAAANNGLPLLGQFIPTCNDDGTYAARQCQGSVCYCVDPTGVQIPDYTANIGESANMDCQCARDQFAYMQSGLIGRLFSCTATGSYQRYQCVGSVCFCADNLGNQLAGSPTVNIGNIGSLQC